MPSTEDTFYPTDVVVAVMGVTGTGKSTFIRLVTGNDKIKVGERLQSETNTVSTYRFSYQGVNFVLVDTPGFDDTDVPDESVLGTITNWLTESYREGKRLNGILYLHRIIDPRMQGTPQRSFNVFRRLCGSKFSKQTILGTTFWRALMQTPDGETIGKQRLEELVAGTGYWGPMISGGSEVVRIPDDRIGARKLLLKFSGMHRSILQVQDEIVNQRLDPSDTSAAKGLYNAQIEQEKAAVERDKKVANELHQLKLEIMKTKKNEATRNAEAVEELQALRREMTQMHLEHERKLSEQETRWKQEMLNQEQAKTAAFIKQNEASQRANRLALACQTRDNACRLLINQLHMGQVNGGVKCAIKPNEGKNIAKCAHCASVFRGFGMYKCNLCRGSHYHVCDPCYGSGKRCLNKSHQMFWKDAVPFNAPLRSRTQDAQNSNILCDRCDQPVLQVYLHCSVCRDNDWDLCIDCATNGKDCDGWWWQGHQLSIVTRH